MTDLNPIERLHCPRCGHLPQVHVSEGHPNQMIHEECDFIDSFKPFGLSFRSDVWGKAIRSELARQALELRAHSVNASTATHRHGVLELLNAAHIVKLDYIWLGENPLMLPGEGAKT